MRIRTNYKLIIGSACLVLIVALAALAASSHVMGRSIRT